MRKHTPIPRCERPAGRLLHRGLPLLLVACLLGGLLAGCEINEPAMPTFDTSLTIPLGVERVDLLEAVEDEDYIVIGDDGSLSFTVDGDPDTMSFDFELTADIGSQTIEQGLGEFEIAASAPVDYQFQLGDIWAPASGVSGMPAVVPSFPIDVLSAPQDVPDIDSAVLTQGQVVITVDNQLPVPVSADSGPGQLVVTLENPADGAAFAVLTFPEIAAGSSNTQSADLAGVTMPGSVQVRMSGESAGSSGSLVTVNSTDSINIQAGYQGLQVSSATAVIGPQSFTTSFDTELPADYAITEAEISSGAVTLQLSNGMPVPCEAVLTWQHLQDGMGQPLSRSYQLVAGQSLNRSIDFAGYTLESGGAPLEMLTAEVSITSPGSEGHSVALSSAAGLTAELQGGTISFGSVTGLVPATSVAIDPISEEIDLPDEMDGIELVAASMTLRVSNAAGLPADLDLSLSGVSATGSVVSMAVQERILASDDSRAATTTIVLNQNNSDIVNFLNNLPTSINLAGDVLVGGDGEIGTVRQGDYAVVSWDIVAPMEVVINGTDLDSDPSALDLDADMRDMIHDRAGAAFIQTEILNHLPVGVQITIKAHSDTNLIVTDPLLAIGPLDVVAAIVDPFTRLVSMPVTSTPLVELTAAEAKIFGTEGLHTLVEVHLPPSDGSVRMLSTDYLEVRGVIRMDVLVDDEW